jgi:hypothetical protein
MTISEKWEWEWDKKTVPVVMQTGKFYAHPLFVMVICSETPPALDERLIRLSVMSHKPSLNPMWPTAPDITFSWIQPNESFLFIEHYPDYARVLTDAGTVGWIYTMKVMAEIYEDPTKPS